jgi:phage portal protein BeeE
MGLISMIETRTSGVNDPTMWINTLLESSNYATKSGTVITADTALKISTVYACVTILAQTIASLPMTVNRRLESGGNETAEDHCGRWGLAT